MLHDCIRLNVKQKKVLLIFACMAFVCAMLALLEPGYKDLCTNAQHAAHEECPRHNLVYVALWYLGNGLNAASGVLTAFATIFIGVYTWTLWRSTERGGEHFRVTERAYVKVSPFEPGVIWDGDGKGGFKVVYRIKNFGSTPARVTDVISNAIAPPKDMRFDNEIPDNVRHQFPKESRTFLVKDDEFYQHPHTAIEDAERPLVESGALKMIVWGYADYIDQFGVRHRAGFGRQYLPNAKTLNLVFPDTGAWNYDRVRKPGEGIDWDES